jgi:hypothetical protein
VVVDSEGGDLRKFCGKGKPLQLSTAVCVKRQGAARGGLLNPFALAHIKDAEVVWKAEGLSDLLAIHSLIPPEKKDRHVVIANANGATEGVDRHWVELLTDKVVFVVGVADRAGQIGVEKWVAHLQGKAKEVRNVRLPFPVVEGHGRDARDFLEGVVA